MTLHDFFLCLAMIGMVYSASYACFRMIVGIIERDIDTATDNFRGMLGWICAIMWMLAFLKVTL